MATNALMKYSLPIPPIEKKWRTRLWYGSLGLVAIGTLAVAEPMLSGAVQAGKHLVALGLLAGGAAAIGSLAIWAQPIVQKQFALWAYRIASWQQTNYPMEQMGIWYNFLLAKWKKTQETQRKVGAHRTSVEAEIETANTTIHNAAELMRDSKAILKPAEIEELEDQVAAAQQRKEAFQKILKRIDPALETIALMEDVNRRKVRQFKRIMQETLIMKEVSDVVSELNTDLSELMGANQQESQAEAARDMIVNQMGQAFGQLEILELQAQSLFNAVNLDDQMALSRARAAMLESMRTIDGETKVISVDPMQSIPTSLVGAREQRRLLDH